MSFLAETALLKYAGLDQHKYTYLQKIGHMQNTEEAGLMSMQLKTHALR